MKKQAFIDTIAGRTGLDKSTAGVGHGLIIDFIKEKFLKEESVTIIGFGKFDSLTRKASGNRRSNLKFAKGFKDWINVGNSQFEGKANADIVEYMVAKTSMPKATARLLIKSFFEVLVHKLYDSESISIFGFGKFELRLRSARMMRNPSTGKQFRVEECYVPRFTPFSALRVKANQNL